jgi:Reverse transcriptase (RNA-dependent DNA polymerase)
MVLPTDKNMGPSIISCKEYHRLTLQALDSSFEHMNTTSSIIITEYIKDLNFSIDGKLLRTIKPTKHLNLPQFTGIPKVHKIPIKLRPIINASDCFTTNLSKLIQLCLSPLYNFINKLELFAVRSTDEYQEKLKNICPHYLDSNIITEAYDIESLYTNIPHELVIQSVDFLCCFSRTRHFMITFERNDFIIELHELIDLIKIYLKYNFLLYKSKFNNNEYIYKQIKGIPTGGNCSPTLADIVLSYKELEFKIMQPEIWEYYKYSGRYLDDLFIITKKNNPNHILSIYGNDFKLKATCENDEDKIFLDLQIKYEHNNKRFTWKLYRKPNNSYMYIHYKSFIPEHVKNAFILNEFNRLRSRCYYDNDYNKEANFFIQKLCERGYSKSLINNVFKSRIKYNDNTQNLTWTVFPYQNKYKKNTLLDLINTNENSYNIAFKNQRKLQALLSVKNYVHP